PATPARKATPRIRRPGSTTRSASQPTSRASTPSWSQVQADSASSRVGSALAAYIVPLAIRRGLDYLRGEQGTCHTASMCDVAPPGDRVAGARRRRSAVCDERRTRRVVRVTVLGSGDAFGSGGRLHSAYLIEAAGATFLLDCGPTVLQSLKRLG